MKCATAGTDSAFCMISHQANNGFELVRISGGNDTIGFARWGVFSSKFRKYGIDCRTLPGFKLMAAVRRTDNIRAEFDLEEFLRHATIEQVKTVKSIFCVFAVGNYIDSICAAVRQDSSKIPMDDHSRRTAGPASGRRIKDKIPAGTLRAST